MGGITQDQGQNQPQTKLLIYSSPRGGSRAQKWGTQFRMPALEQSYGLRLLSLPDVELTSSPFLPAESPRPWVGRYKGCLWLSLSAKKKKKACWASAVLTPDTSSPCQVAGDAEVPREASTVCPSLYQEGLKILPPGNLARTQQPADTWTKA